MQHYIKIPIKDNEFKKIRNLYNKSEHKATCEEETGNSGYIHECRLYDNPRDCTNHAKHMEVWLRQRLMSMLSNELDDIELINTGRAHGE